MTHVDDTDGSHYASHHTLGPGQNQASPGNHSHDGGESVELLTGGGGIGPPGPPGGGPLWIATFRKSHSYGGWDTKVWEYDGDSEYNGHEFAQGPNPFTEEQVTGDRWGLFIDEPGIFSGELTQNLLFSADPGIINMNIGLIYNSNFAPHLEGLQAGWPVEDPHPNWTFKKHVSFHISAIPSYLETDLELPNQATVPVNLNFKNQYSGVVVSSGTSTLKLIKWASYQWWGGAN